MKDKPIINIMHVDGYIASNDSVYKALETMKVIGVSSLPVVNYGKLVGVIRESNLLSAAINNSLAEKKVEEFISNIPVVVFPSITIGKSAEIMQKYNLQMLAVVNETGSYFGYITRSDVLSAILNTAKPANIAGMATPLGVYLTTGSISAGAGNFGLFLTGVSMMLLNFIAVGLVFGMAWLIQKFGIYNLFDVMILPPEYLSKSDNMLCMVMYGLTLPIFLILLRVSPLSGYHAAEHQVVHAIENGNPLSLEFVSMQPRAHPRCGTNLVAAIIIFLIIYHIFNSDIAILIAMAVIIFGWRSAGALLQKYVTTKPPTARQLNNGISTGKELLEKFRANPTYNISGWKRIWYTGMLQVTAGAAVMILIAQILEKYLF